MASFELKQYVDNLIEKVNADKKKRYQESVELSKRWSKLSDTERKAEREKLTKPYDVKRIKAMFQASTSAMYQEQDIDYSLKCSSIAKKWIDDYCKLETNKEFWEQENWVVNNREKLDVVDLYYDILKQESFYNFQSYIFFMERKRASRKRFYYPRRKTLKIVVDDLMDLEARKYKFYGLSMPSRTGKSTICIFFLSWVMLKRPNSHNAMCGHSGILAKGFYKEVMNLITSQDYCFEELYSYWHPEETMLQDKSAEEFTINLGEPDRFSTLVCRGIDGTWTGAVDISGGETNFGYLYVDDLVRDRQHALSPQRMNDTFNEYLNKCRDRKIDGALELMVGTLWNVTDPLERIRIQEQDNPEYKFRRIPALDENGKSNFDYDFGGFSTEYYLEMKENLEAPEWAAKYMQAPYVREGLLFPIDELRYFDGMLPDGERKVVAVIDPAFGGGDSLSMPICASFKDGDKYIVDWVFNRGTQKTTVKAVVNKIMQYGITEVRIERNSGGLLFADSVKDALAKAGCMHCRISLISAPVKMSKEDKISGYSDAVKDNFVFLLPRRDVKRDVPERLIRSQEYQAAMEEMCSYSAQGRNIHDDAADAMVQLAMFFEKTDRNSVKAISNPFRY